MCDGGSHAHLYRLQSDPGENAVCVFVIGCLCGYVKLGRWEKLVLRQMDHLHWLVLTGRYVSFSGGCWGGHSAASATEPVCPSVCAQFHLICLGNMTIPNTYIRCVTVQRES